MRLITETYKNKIVGTIGCFDRVVLTGTIPYLCYPQGMTSYLYSQNIRIFDYSKYMEQFRKQIIKNAEALAKSINMEKVEYVPKSSIRKEKIISKVLEKRGMHPGLVHVLSAMETCSVYTPWHNKNTGKTYLKRVSGKCIHYYFYFIDEYLGLGFIRVQTWGPFKLQIYFNGHNVLKNKLDNASIKYSMIDNAFDYIEDFKKAQELSDEIDVDKMHKIFDKLANKYCGVHSAFNQVYHWSITQIEYASDIIFKQQKQLQSIYTDLLATAIHTVKPENIVTFFGKKLSKIYQGEIGNNYNIRIEGRRIKHIMGKNSIKMYDKFSKILRIETTSNDISFFKHYRKVEHRNGDSEEKFASLKKNIYSLNALKKILKASNNRYLEFISAIENNEVGRKRLQKITESKVVNNRNFKGFNLFAKKDLSIFTAILKGSFNIYGFQNKDLRKTLPYLNSGQISRILRRLKVHGIIKRAGKTYKYYLTKLGKITIISGLKVKEMALVPLMNY